MGCSQSMDSLKIALRKKSPPKPALSPREKDLVLSSWKRVEDVKRELGVKVYKRFLHSNPHLKHYFTEFRDIEVDEISKAQAHPYRLMLAINNAVVALTDAECCVAYLIELGRRHGNIQPGFKPNANNLKELRKATLYSLREFLESEWNEEMEQAWNRLFDFMSDLFLIGINAV